MKIVTSILIVIAVLFLYAFLDQYAEKSYFSASLTRPKLANSSQTNNNSSNNSQSGSNSRSAITNPSSPTTSQYIDKVTISRVTKATINNESVIHLRVRPNKGEEINLTGFTIKTRKGELKIQKGLEYLKSNYPNRDIVISEPLTVYLIGNVSPLIVKDNFRSNQCINYFSRSNDIYPRLYNSCQAPKLASLGHLTPYCQDYLIHKNRCEMPNYSDNFKISTDNACVNFILNYYTYNGCFDKNFRDDKFLLSSWYIYLNKNIVEDLHDTISLYDKNGLLVDKYTY